MKNAITFLLLLLGLCGRSLAGEGPVVGVWEQVAINGQYPNGNITRISLIFTDKKITENTIFSALADGGNSLRVFCCLKVDASSNIGINNLLGKYNFIDFDVQHLKNVKGGKYIYTATLVEPIFQNKNMKDLVRSVSGSYDISPFSAAAVSGEFGVDEVGYDFNVSGRGVKFRFTVDVSKRIWIYDFFVDGRRRRFSEEMPPDD